MPDATHTTPVLQVHELTKKFGDFTALDRISFDLPHGEILGLLGVNGAGKTTAMNMILGLTTPTSGSVRMFGHSLQTHRIEILQQCNFCSAYTSLPANLLVYQNLKVFGRLYRVKNLDEKIDSLLETFGIQDLKRRVTGHLSAGESTRLHLCKALLNDPKLLLLDEPTASLDPDIADRVRKIIRDIQRRSGMTVLYTSHNMRDVEEVCDRAIFLHHGKILCEGSPQEIVRKFSESSLENVFLKIARSGEMQEDL